VLGLRHRGRVLSLTLMSTSLAVNDGGELPPMTSELQEAMSEERPPPDWEDRDSVIEYLAEGERPYAGPGSFDEERARALAGRVYDRSINLASSGNHFLADDEPIDASLDELAGIPTLVIHGTADGMFPGHGRFLAEAIPGARLVELEDVGHQYPPQRTWDGVIDLLVEHTR